MTTTRGSVVQHKETKECYIVRLVDNGLLAKSIADDTPSRWVAEADFVLASEADVPWLKLRTMCHRGNTLYCWELPSGEMVCEDESVSFYRGIAFSTRFSQFDANSPSPVLR